MSIAERFLPEFDREMASTRRVLERVPAGHLEWQPHEKSMTLGRLATHVAEIPGWAVMALTRDSVDLAPAEGAAVTPRTGASREEILSIFEEAVTTGREAIASADDDAFMASWSLLRGGETVFTAPKSSVLRQFVLNHGIHHRGQLTVFLRLLDAPVPGTYGPSADDPGF